MGKLYVMMGKSAVGKDTVFRMVAEAAPEIRCIIPYTTRPIRSGETDGNEYFFQTLEQRRALERQGKIIECRKYETVHGPWYYYTVDDGQFDFSAGDMMMISTLEGYEKIRDYLGEEKVSPIYITVDDFTRLQRSLAREQEQDVPCVAEVCRRFLADEADFSPEKLAAAGVTREFYVENLDSKACVDEILARRFTP